MSQMGNTKLGFMNVPNCDVIAFDMKVNITVRRSRQSGVARATCPD